jgi:hypothetical protein
MQLTGFSSAWLPQVESQIVDAEGVCERPLPLFTEAPEPISSSEPFDVVSSIEVPPFGSHQIRISFDATRKAHSCK